MNLVQVFLEYVKAAGARVLLLWFGLVTATWLVYYWSSAPLTAQDLKGATLFWGAVAIASIALYDRFRRKSPARVAQKSKKRKKR